MTLNYTQASAGSGKTTSIEKDVTDKLVAGFIEPSQIMAVTFTKDAAAELKNRISQSLLTHGKPELAIGIMSARVGTVHAVFGQLLSDFAFELGLSPKQRVLDTEDETQLFYEALDKCITLEQAERLNHLGEVLSIEDWRNDILSIIRLMRTNCFDVNLIEYFIKDSIDFLLKNLPTSDPQVTMIGLKKLLQGAINAGIQLMQQLSKPLKGLEKVIHDSEKILREPNLAWQAWIKISKFDPTKKGEPIFVEVMDMASKALECSEFKQDMISFIEAIFDASKRVMHEFSSIKKLRGLVDFTDQEALSLEALNHPEIQKRIRDEIQYLIVDEFQDTSPIQMAIFSKMSELVDDVLMVGDAKQAIYGFRGSDPKLALNVLDYIQKGDGVVSSLPNSWRSRPGLVALTNDLFTKPFLHLLTPKQVQLKSKCDYELASAELSWWTLDFADRKNNEKILSALVEGVREHIRSGIEIWDKQHKKKRQATWRDIAVLFRTNDEAKAFATSCAKTGIPLSLERSGLLETPEVSLALACLRILVDSSDSIAVAEVLLYVTGNGPEIWLSSRLEAVAKENIREWENESHTVLKDLVQLRSNIKKMSVKEALDLAMMTADVTGIVTQWKEMAKLTEHRLANLSKLVASVDDYENHCSAQCYAATPAGFILWLKNQEQHDKDEQAPNPGNAITIATYHGSKGLEWPIVICCSLDSSLKVSLFGSRIIETMQEFDWHHPLSGRMLRYCPNPFAVQKGNDPLTERFKQSKDWEAREQQERNEAIQLLYVGMTRARDQLILTTVNGADSEWLALLQNEHLPPLEGEMMLPSGDAVRVERKTYIKPDDEGHIENKRVRHWFAPIQTSHAGELNSYFAPPSSAEPIENGICHVVHDFGSRLTLTNVKDMEKLGVVLHQCLALVINNPKIAPSIIEDILDNSVLKQVSAGEIIAQAHHLLTWIGVKYPKARLHTEYPFTRHLENSSLQQGSIDLLVETDDGWIIIDHKSNPQSKSEWESIATKYSGQLNEYKNALERLSGKSVISTLIHFSVSGGVVELNLDEVCK